MFLSFFHPVNLDVVHNERSLAKANKLFLHETFHLTPSLPFQFNYLLILLTCERQGWKLLYELCDNVLVATVVGEKYTNLIL